MRNVLAYPLGEGGVVRHWLARGPVVTPLAGLEPAVDASGTPYAPDGRWTLNYWAWHPRVQALKARIYAAVAPGPELVDAAPTLGPDGAWRYLALSDAGTDDMADFSRFSFTPTLFSGHLYTEIVCPTAGAWRAELLTVGPAQLWLDGRHLFAHPGPFGYVHPQVVPLTLELAAGVNRLWLRGDMIGLREARLGLGLALRPTGAAAEAAVQLPLGPFDPAAWRRAERDLGAVRLPRFDFGDDAPWGVLAEGAAPCALRVRLELPGAPPTATPATTLRLEPGVPFPLPLTAALRAAEAATPGEVALQAVFQPSGPLPLERRFELLAGGVPYRHAPYGTYASRREEAVAHLAGVRGDVMGSLAAVRSGRAQHIDGDAVRRAVAFLDERRDTADFFAVSLMVLMFRHGTGGALRPADRGRIVDAFRGFKFWIDEPGLDAMCYFTENHQVLFHVAEYLAGLYWPDMLFTNSGRTGRAKAAAAGARLTRWIERRLRSDFCEWDSNAYLAMDAFALLALCDCTDDEPLRARATNLLDLLFLRLATQSFRGTHGSSHGRCYVAALKSGRSEGTSGLQRIAWGMGTFNGETRATGMLAMSERYRVPVLIQRIGAHLPAVLVTRARSCGAFLPDADLRDDTWDVRTHTRRTPAGMLAAAVDQRPGALGIQEHLWQATLGPDAVVFTSHPGNLLQHGNARPNAWAGSARLPHVGMHDRTVLCLYGPPDAPSRDAPTGAAPRGAARDAGEAAADPLGLPAAGAAPADQGPRNHAGDRVGLGYSHAYFPTASFDDWQVEGHWAFARYGEGFLALWGDGPLALTQEGDLALHELRSGGPGRAWLCTVGSVAEDGAFADFEARVAALPAPRADAHRGLELRWRTPAGDALALRWGQGLWVDGRPLDSAAFERYGNRYTRTAEGDAVITLRHEGESRTIALGPA